MLFQRKCLPPILFFVCSIPLVWGCLGKPYSSPEGYDLTRPVKMELGKAVMEISGIAYYPAKGSLLGVCDSKTQVFELSYKNYKLADFTDKIIPPDSDIEDIAVVGDTLYILSSRGLIIEAPQLGRDTAAIVHHQLNLSGANDFETLYYDPTVNGLVMVCKSCAYEKGEHRRSAFLFHLKTKQFDSTAFFTFSTEEVKKLLKDDNAKFDPSAAAIHPLNKRLYVLSSAGNLLVVTDTRGKIIEAFKLNPDLFPQAEGIAFAPNGSMFITNEGKYGVPTLLIFPFRQTMKKKTK